MRKVEAQLVFHKGADGEVLANLCWAELCIHVCNQSAVDKIFDYKAGIGDNLHGFVWFCNLHVRDFALGAGQGGSYGVLVGNVAGSKAEFNFCHKR